MQKRRSRLATDKSPPENMRDGNLKETLDLSALRGTPGFMIRILQIQIFEEFFEYFSEAGFSPAEHSVLITVRDNPFVTQSEVAGALRIQLPNLVKILLKLETKGLIKRKRSTRDKRAVELVLTGRGEQVAVHASEMADDFNRQMLSPLDEKERKQFLLMLSRLVHTRAKQGS
jgi:DNA-binding MarR family transcriptional regulator